MEIVAFLHWFALTLAISSSIRYATDILCIVAAINGNTVTGQKVHSWHALVIAVLWVVTIATG